MQLLTDIMLNGTNRYPKKPALAIKPRYRTLTWTYRDLFAFSQNIAKFLDEKGVVKGDRVILWASNSPYWLGIFFGCLLRGAIVVPLHAENTPEFIQKVVDQTEPKVFFKSSDLESAGLEKEWVDIDYLGGSTTMWGVGYPTSDAGYPTPTERINEEDVAEILYTSGTTGEPKGAVLTHKNIISNLQRIPKIIPVKKTDRILSLLPLSHIFEQIVELHALQSGAFIAYVPALSSSIIRKTLKAHRITKMAAVPEFLTRVILAIEAKAKQDNKEKVLALLFKIARAFPLRFLRRFIFSTVHRQFGGKLGLVVSGGAPLNQDTARKWHLLGVDIIQGYGLTETAALVSALAQGDQNINSVGKVIPGIDVKIAEDHEILVKGPNVTQGYWRNEVKTKEILTEHGWLRTGDLGYFDKNGYLYINGRKKFMILTASGQNVYPEDIEAELNKEADVKDSAVVALEKDGKTMVHAVLLGDIKNPEELVMQVNSRLSSFQNIQSWSIWPFDDFPRTITRKVKRHEVLEYLKKQKVPEGVRGKQESSSYLVGIVAEVLGISTGGILKNAPIVSLGLDSLARIELVARIEEELGVEIDEAQVTPQTTIAHLENLVARKPHIKKRYVLSAWPRNFLTKIFREVFYWILVVPVFKTFMHIRVEGLENIANLKGSVIFVSNHISHLDTAAIYLALPRVFRNKTAVAAAADILFEQFVYVQPLLTFLFNTYPIVRSGQTKVGLENTGELVDAGWSILFFAEGGIPDTKGSITLKQGVGVLASEMQVPIVPAKIKGTDEIMPKHAHFPKKRGETVVRFDKLLRFKRDMPYSEITKQIQDALESL